ncbi:exo-beta-N-acetylmuramidase NamZ family protein [Desulfoferula mesophila]|uniref:exo-beta-N-acetylmuramidase NamZ family protein n=1 Tax=Desulfoferula mesophila TaxID=3058419 RepID=UPI0030CE00D9
MSSKVVTGLGRLGDAAPADLNGASLGLLANPAAVGPDLSPAWVMVNRVWPGGLKALFGPQHGFFAEKQDNMVESEHGTHPGLGVPIYSLYGQTRRPTPEMLSGLDALLVDLVDVGCRVYTFFSTLVACLEECAAAGVEVVVLDRPNPIGRRFEGPVLPPELMSFVGAHAIPLSHGLTLGELARLVVAERNLNVALRVIPCAGWAGEDFAATGLPWVMPSPNMPTLDTARVYPGQVLLEGASLSEGRGTTRPFEIFGMPGLDPAAVLDALEPEALDGAVLRPLNFEPTFHKFAGQVCGGFQIHVTDPGLYRPVRATLALLGAINRAQPGLWGLRPPPYEYEHERRPLDLLLGDAEAVDMLVAGATTAELEARWQGDLEQWDERRQRALLYPA